MARIPVIPIEDRRYRIVVFYVPYLKGSARGTVRKTIDSDLHRYQDVCMTSFPFGKDTYTYEQAVDILHIFEERWRAGGSIPAMEPYAEALAPGSAYRFTLAEIEAKNCARDYLHRLTGNYESDYIDFNEDEEEAA